MCDANIGSFIAGELERHGHDVTRVIGNQQTASDAEILRAAAATDRVLITCDRDFGELIFKQDEPAPPGILYVRFEPQDVREVFPRLLAVIASGDIVGNMTVIADTQDRRTPLPRQKDNNA